MTNVRWLQFHDYSGCAVTGTQAVPLPSSDLHMERAFYLTTTLEAPMFGSVQSYDGAGISGGPQHSIAVLPSSMQQGDLFKLLRHLQISAPNSVPLQSLFHAYATQGWAVALDGVLRNAKTGVAISAAVIRDTFAPPGGKVPETGPQFEQAKRWALLHSAAFSDPATFAGQRDYSITNLIHTRTGDELLFYKTMNLVTLRVWTVPPAADAHIPDEEYNNHLTLQEDLAMCMYHSHSVNGPSPAAEVLKRVVAKVARGNDFARLMVWSLGTKDYGRWKDTADGKNRYDRTRDSALASGLWPKDFFTGPTAFMPKDLPATAGV
jgi:hypothetical protein